MSQQAGGVSAKSGSCLVGGASPTATSSGGSSPVVSVSGTSPSVSANSKHLLKPSDIPITPRNKPTNKRVSGARVLTSADCFTMLKDKEEKKKKEAEEKECKKKERESLRRSNVKRKQKRRQRKRKERPKRKLRKLQSQERYSFR